MIVQVERIAYETGERPKNDPSGEQSEVGVWLRRGSVISTVLVESWNASYTQMMLKICPNSHGIDGETEVQRGAGTGPKSHFSKTGAEPRLPNSCLGNSPFCLLHQVLCSVGGPVLVPGKQLPPACGRGQTRSHIVLMCGVLVCDAVVSVLFLCHTCHPPQIWAGFVTSFPTEYNGRMTSCQLEG